MATLRHPAVAGMFYPDNADELHAQLQALLAVAHVNGLRPKAIIAPHAGYIYSGPIAASVYAQLKPYAHEITRVVLLGPAHRVAVRGIAVPSVDLFAMPLGNIPIDHAALRLIAGLPFVRTSDQAHAQEHSLEVQLPFLQEILGEFSLVPLVVGEANPTQVAQVLERLWGGAETVIVISSDLSHYHDYATAQRLDAATSRAIEQLRFEDLNHDSACGCNPVSGLLYVARQRGLHAQALDVRNSGDTAGSRDHVVGYGAYVIN
ncbi:MAG: AmmeMemoRadiSam system protein B [Gammaproteobacteria bacterium]|nr:AmmeMemoRadiSam system protein B [Gammaproteobacteria bacterium]